MVRSSVSPAWVLATILAIPVVAAIPPPDLPDPLPDPFGQNDAGSGSDAPNVFDLALPLAPGIFQGMLLTTPRGGMAGVQVNDREDWYEFDVKKGQKVTMDLDYAGQPQDGSILAQAVAPDGAVALQFGAGEESRWFFASAKGAWRMRLVTEGPGVAYQARVSVEDAGGFSGGIANPGYVIMGFDLERGSQIWGQFSMTSVRTMTEPSSSTSMMLNGDLDVLAAGSWTVPTFARGAHVRVGEHSQSTFARYYTAEGADDYLEGWSPSEAVPDVLIVNGEFRVGRVYLAIFGTAEHRYFNYNLTFVGDVAFVGKKVGQPEAVFERTLAEHEGGAAVQTLPGAVSNDLSTSVESPHVLLAYYHCKTGTGVHSCAVEDPSGDAMPITQSGAWYASAERGRWTFSRGTEASFASDEKVLLHGVLAKLPDDD